MVKLLQRLKIWRELKRLESKARENPSPTTFVDLGQVYINLGMHDQTVRVSEEALALFPESKELRKLNNFAKNSHLKARVKELRGRLNKTPEAASYRELANLYLGMGDFGAVVGTCEEAIRRHPDDAGSYLLMARSRLEVFYRDLKAREGIEAVRCLGKVVSLERDNMRAHKLMAEALYRVGAINRSLHHLTILRDHGAADLEVEALFRKANDEATGSEKEDIEQLFHEAESRNSLVRGPAQADPQQASAPGEDRSLGVIRDTLGQLAAIPGVQKATYIKGAKALIKGQIRDGKDPFLRAVRVVSKAAQRSCRRMDLGSFSKGVVDGGFGHICICCYGDVVAAVLCDRGTPVNRILNKLHDVVAESLFSSSEAPV